MKKSLMLAAGAMVLAACVSFVACKNTVTTEYRSGDSGEREIVLSADTDVGSLILKNGSVVPAENVSTVANKDDVMAIVFYKDESAKYVLAMGVEVGTGKNGLTAET